MSQLESQIDALAQELEDANKVLVDFPCFRNDDRAIRALVDAPRVPSRLLGSALVLASCCCSLCMPRDRVCLARRALSGSALVGCLPVVICIVLCSLCFVVRSPQGHKANKQAAHDAKHALVLEKTEKVAFAMLAHTFQRNVCCRFLGAP